MSAPAASWCDPAGESPAQVKGSVLLGSECCVTTGDSGCEAYTAIAWGVGLSHERSDIAGAESLHSLEGNMCGTAMRGADALPGSKATSRAKGSHRNLGGLASDRRCGVQCAEYGGPHRSRWSEGRGPRGMRTGKARTGLIARLACHRRRNAYGNCLPFGPEVGAVCGKAARTVRCGGRAMKRASLPLRAPAASWCDPAGESPVQVRG